MGVGKVIRESLGKIIKGKGKDDSYWVKKAEDLYQTAKTGRGAFKERQMMVNLAWYKGLHNLKFDTLYNRFIWDDKDPIGFNINKVYQTVRAVRGAVTKYDPVWSIDALPYGNLESNEERMIGYFLSSAYEDLNMKHTNKEVVLNGVLYGIGIYQYGWDDYVNDGEGNVFVDSCDVFDTYLDPLTTRWDLSDCGYVIKIKRRSIKELQKDKNYINTKELQRDGKLSSSEYKDKLLTAQSTNGESDDSVLVYETWICDYEDKNEEKEREGRAEKKKSKKMTKENEDKEDKEEEDGKKDKYPEKKIRVITVCQGKLLRNEVTEFDRLPFVVYESDTNANEVGGEGFVKNIVPLNRALNYLEKNTLEYHALFAKGKWMIRGDADVKTVSNQNGQITRVSAAGNLEQVPLQSMAGSVFNQEGNLNRYIEDIGGAQEALLGRAPQGVTAGIAFEQLVSNNMNVIVDLIDNQEMSLSFLGEQLLKLMYKHYNTTRLFRFREGTLGKLGGAVIGQGKDAQAVINDSGKAVDAIKLPELAKVKVRIVSSVGFTKAGKMETLFNLRKGGDVSRKTLLENLDIDPDQEQDRLITEQEASQPAPQAMPPAPPMPEGMPMEAPMEAPMGAPTGGEVLPPELMAILPPEVTPEMLASLSPEEIAQLTQILTQKLAEQSQGVQPPL